MPLLATDDCVLIIIDLQPGFYVNRPDVDRSRFSAVVRHAARLAGLSDVLSIPVVVTEEEPDRNGRTAPEVVGRLPAATPVLEKPVFDLSADGEIWDAVRRTGRTHAVLAGLETDVCVLHSALGLLERGLTVSAAVDALYAPGPDHQAGLDRLRFHGVDTIAWDELATMSVEVFAARVEARLGSALAFITFDVDFVDPAFCPGTGTPEAGGPSSYTALQLVRSLTGPRFVAGDVVEVAPPYDGRGQPTATLAATVLHELLSLHALRVARDPSGSRRRP